MIPALTLLAELDLRDEFVLKDNTPVADVYGTPADLINAWLPNFYIFAGIILFGLLVFGGLSIIAGGDSKATEKGSKAITGAVIGFAIMITAYWIIQVVEIATGMPILKSTL